MREYAVQTRAFPPTLGHTIFSLFTFTRLTIMSRRSKSVEMRQRPYEDRSARSSSLPIVLPQFFAHRMPSTDVIPKPEEPIDSSKPLITRGIAVRKNNKARRLTPPPKMRHPGSKIRSSTRNTQEMCAPPPYGHRPLRT